MLRAPSLYFLRANSRVFSTMSEASVQDVGEIKGRLKAPHLWQTTSFINGNFVDGSGRETFSVVNPATGDVIAECSRHGSVQTKEAIAAARVAWQKWKNTTVKERSKLLMKMHSLVDKYRDDLALIMTLESGKPLAEAKAEVVS